ncbi:MAG: DnaJ domain-containing protein, partial [Chloroflexota bacterium]
LWHDDRQFVTPGHFADLRRNVEYRRLHPDPLIALGLELPCTEKDVNRAYRRLAKTFHPDGGGDAAGFRELHAAYEAATVIVKASSEGPRVAG